MAKIVITIEDDKLNGIKTTIAANPPFPTGPAFAKAVKNDTLTLAQKVGVATVTYIENLGKR